MRVLGIDPGLATTGWAIVDIDKDIVAVDYGVISTLAGTDNALRLEEIYNDLVAILKKFKPEIAGVESLIFNNNAKTAMAVGEARGICLLALQQAKVPVSHFTPPQIKSAVTGSGRADKKQVQENIKALCSLEEIPKPDDAADAIAAAICCYNSSKIGRMVNESN